MTNFSKIVLALAVLGGSTAVQADTSTFVGLTLGETSNKVSKSDALNENLDHPKVDGLFNNNKTVGLRVGRQDNQGRYYATYENLSGSHQKVKQRQQNLLGSYDLFLPIAAGTQFFGGVSAGVTKLTPNAAGINHGGGLGFSYGVQAGVLQKISQNTSLELGYRYLRTNAKTNFSYEGDKVGSLKLNSSAQTYMSANYTF